MTGEQACRGALVAYGSHLEAGMRAGRDGGAVESALADAAGTMYLSLGCRVGPLLAARHAVWTGGMESGR